MRPKLPRTMHRSHSWWALLHPYCHCILYLYSPSLTKSSVRRCYPHHSCNQPINYLLKIYCLMLFSSIWCTISKLRRATSKQAIGLKATQIQSLWIKKIVHHNSWLISLLFPISVMMYILGTIYLTENSLKINQSISQTIAFKFIHRTSTELKIIDIKYHRKVGERSCVPHH